MSNTYRATIKVYSYKDLSLDFTEERENYYSLTECVEKDNHTEAVISSNRELDWDEILWDWRLQIGSSAIITLSYLLPNEEQWGFIYTDKRDRVETHFTCTDEENETDKLLAELTPIPEFNSLSDDEKNKVCLNITGRRMEAKVAEFERVVMVSKDLWEPAQIA